MSTGSTRSRNAWATFVASTAGRSSPSSAERSRSTGLRRAAKVDSNQEDIVKALRRCGISVEIIGKPLDLLVHNPRRDRTSLMEVKNKDGRDEFTKDQIDFMARWPGPIDVVRSIDEALQAVLGQEVMK